MILTLPFVPQKRNNYEPYLLRKGALFVYTIILLFVNVLSNLLPISIFSDVPKAYADSINAETLISLTNKEREKYGLNDLKANLQLTSAAYAKANDMLSKQYWDHFGPNGETPWQFITEANYQYVFAGENLAKGFKTSEGVHQAWMASTTHRENILSGKYKDIGIAVVSGNLLGEDVVLVVQMFGNITYETVAPTINNTEVNPGSTNEKGEIKSIKIEKPQNGATLNTPDVDIEGSITGNIKTEYIVRIEEDNNSLGNVESDGSKWSYTSDEEWTQGTHKVTASIQDVSSQNLLKDESIFTIDSVAPSILYNSVSILNAGGSYTIKVAVSDSLAKVMFVLDSNSFEMKDNNKGLYETSFTMAKYPSSASIIATDVAGNISTLDITSIVRENYGTSNSILGIQSIIGSVIPAMSTKDYVNFGLLLFILILLSIEIYYYKKIGELGKKSMTLFTWGIWWLLLFFGIFSGFSGQILGGIGL